jgi:hypothetical protein
MAENISMLLMYEKFVPGTIESQVAPFGTF